MENQIKKELEDAIKKAKEIGIRFHLISLGTGIVGLSGNANEYDFMVNQTLTDAQFLKSLNNRINEIENRLYLRILKEQGCIKN